MNPRVSKILHFSHHCGYLPSQAGSEHRLPIPFDHEPIWNLSLDGMLAELSALDHADPKEDQDQRQGETEAKADPPNTFCGTIVVCSQNDEGDASCDHKPEIDRKVSCHGH